MRSKLLVILITSTSIFSLIGCSHGGNSMKAIETAATGQGTQKAKEEMTGKAQEPKYEQKEPDFLSNLSINRNGISVSAPWKLGDLEPLGIDINPPDKNWNDKETYLPDRGINNFNLYVDGITRAEDAPRVGASFDDLQRKYGKCDRDNFYVLRDVDSANYGGRHEDVDIYLKIGEKDGIVTHIYLDIRGQIY